ncbi:MAG: hypothetical protein IRZ04_18805 [Rhodospirillales bacterium]|nr:hypothetical protein [Rhodospirillales bacterium]
MKLTGISYVSPVMRYDPEARVVIVQHRDTATGEVSRQIPSEEAVRDLRVDAVTGAQTKHAATPEGAAEASAPVSGGDGVSLTV